MKTGEPNDAHILVVDDDERIRTLLTKFLAQNGYYVSAARDAAHARRLLEDGALLRDAWNRFRVL